MAVQSEFSTITQSVTDSAELVHGGGAVEIAVQGNFNGCTITLHAKLTGKNYGIAQDDAGNATFQVAAGTTGVLYNGVVTLPPCTLKLVATTAGASTSVLTVLRTRQFA